MPIDAVHPIPGCSEPFSSITHLVGAAVFAAAGVVLIRRASDHPARVIACTTLVIASVVLLALSGVYHMLAMDTAGRAVLARLDHAAIFLLIAATYTPPLVILFRGAWRRGLLLLVWSLAITAIALKTVFFDDIPEWLSLALYLLLGWIGVFPAVAVFVRFGFRFTQPLFWGAIAYSAGAIADFAREPVLVPGVIEAHELFHLAVLAGLAWHWRFVHRFADGLGGARPAPISSLRDVGVRLWGTGADFDPTG